VKVKELIAFLQQLDPEMLVAYKCYSEQVILEADEIELKRLSWPRPDGWVHDARPDKPTTEYLLFPGN
jgi:hypothetical protein